MNAVKIHPIVTNVPVRWAWHYQHLQSLRDQLIGEHQVQLASISTPVEPHSMDIADSASDEIDHDLTAVMLAQEEDALVEIDAAIQRIFDGSYGTCEETGQLIADARLRALPWTRYTVEAAERLEQKGDLPHAHLAPVASIQGPAPGGLAQTEDVESVEILTPGLARHQREDAVRAINDGAAAAGA